MIRTVLSRAVALAILALGTACSTPQPARDLAAQGLVVVDQAHAEVQGFVDRATLAYRAREGIVRDLARSDISDSARIDFLSAVRIEAGGDGIDHQRSQRLKRIVTLSRTTREQLAADLAARGAEIGTAFGDPVVLPVEKYGVAKRAFANLAQELTAEEWLKFSWNYASEVNHALKGLKAAAPAPAASAASAP